MFSTPTQSPREAGTVPGLGYGSPCLRITVWHRVGSQNVVPAGGALCRFTPALKAAWAPGLTRKHQRSSSSTIVANLYDQSPGPSSAWGERCQHTPLVGGGEAARARLCSPANPSTPGPQRLICSDLWLSELVVRSSFGHLTGSYQWLLYQVLFQALCMCGHSSLRLLRLSVTLTRGQCGSRKPVD